MVSAVQELSLSCCSEAPKRMGAEAFVMVKQALQLADNHQMGQPEQLRPHVKDYILIIKHLAAVPYQNHSHWEVLRQRLLI